MTPSCGLPFPPVQLTREGGCCSEEACSSAADVPSSALPSIPPAALVLSVAETSAGALSRGNECEESCCGESETEDDEDDCGDCCGTKDKTDEEAKNQRDCESSPGQLEHVAQGEESCPDGVEGCEEVQFDDDDDDTLCPCCVALVVEHFDSGGELLSDANLNTHPAPKTYNPCSPLVRLMGTMRRCCRVLEIACAGKTCCFNGPETKPRRSVTPTVVSTCEQADDDPEIEQPTTSSSLGTQPLTLEISGMDCGGCIKKVTRALERLPSVKPLDVDHLSGIATLLYDQDTITPEAVARYVARAGGFRVKPAADRAGGKDSRVILPIQFSRVPPLEVLERLGARPRTELGGYWEILFNSQGEKARQPREVFQELESFGPTLLAVDVVERAEDRVAQDLRRIALRTLASCTLSIPVLVFAWADLPPHPIVYGSASVALTFLIQILGFPIIISSLRSIIYLRRFDVDVLVSVSTVTAFVFSLVAFAFEVAGSPFTTPFFETTALLISLIYVGRLVQAATRRSASSAVRALQELQTTEVLLVENGEEISLDSRLLHYGDVLRIRVDSRIPTDGIVVAGSSEVDQSSATGESLPSLKQVGSHVIAGTLNLNGSLDIHITQLVHENSLAKVSSLVRKAQSSRSRLQDVADRFSALILPIAVVLAVISFVVWMLVNRFGKGMSTSSSAVSALTYALSILIISCPCALAMVVPLVVASSLRAGLREGVLFRSSEALQVAHSTDTVAFDKTGTLSQGSFSIERAEALFDGVDKLVLPLVASNTHPISKAIANSLATTVSRSSLIHKIVSFPGMGIKASVKGYPLLGGNPIFTRTTSLPLIETLTSLGFTLFTVTLGGELISAFGLADLPRPEAAALVADLVKQGKKVVLLSGDNAEAVSRFADSIGLPLEDVRAACSPRDKATFIAELQQEGHRVAFIGDGTNDGPALAQANLAISIGSGSDVAIAASGVVILGGSDLRKSVGAVLGIAQHARQHILAGLAWCGIYFAFALLLTSGALVKVRIEPQWAGLGEVVSVLPVVLVGLGLDWRWRWKGRRVRV